MMAIVDIALTLVIWPCPNCGVQFGVPDDLDKARRRDGANFYCPNGHSMSFGKTEADKLRAELALTQGRLTSARDQRDAAEERRRAVERQLSATKGQVTKLRKRAVAGVCPCCNRTFQALARHMASKHPDFDPTVSADDVEPAT